LKMFLVVVDKRVPIVRTGMKIKKTTIMMS